MFVNSFNVFFYSFAVITVVERAHGAYHHVDRDIAGGVEVKKGFLEDYFEFKDVISQEISFFPPSFH